MKRNIVNAYFFHLGASLTSICLYREKMGERATGSHLSSPSSAPARKQGAKEAIVAQFL